MKRAQCRHQRTAVFRSSRWVVRQRVCDRGPVCLSKGQARSISTLTGNTVAPALQNGPRTRNAARFVPEGTPQARGELLHRPLRVCRGWPNVRGQPVRPRRSSLETIPCTLLIPGPADSEFQTALLVRSPEMNSAACATRAVRCEASGSQCPDQTFLRPPLYRRAPPQR